MNGEIVLVGGQTKRTLPLSPIDLSREEKETSFEQILVENAGKLARTLEKSLQEGRLSQDDPDLMLAASLYFYGISNDELLERLDGLREEQHTNGVRRNKRVSLMADMIYYVLNERGVDLS